MESMGKEYPTQDNNFVLSSNHPIRSHYNLHPIDPEILPVSLF